ncbi:sulfotransferase domain-containing protein [Roseivirga sp. BDSF3-8]|uniref:sulfotransferase domain-containing protein n=1 Tax=Roseivirga sp. BDSF3-8 TaxID=3241598 RepID=UPI0035319B7C
MPEEKTKRASLKKRLRKKFENWAVKKHTELAQKSQVLRFRIFEKMYTQREDDIYVISSYHSGSAILRGLVYHLSSGGDTSFTNVKKVSPALLESVVEQDYLDQHPSPRVIFSPAAYEDFPPETKGKFIFLVRNGMDRGAAGYLFEKTVVNPDLEWMAYLQREFVNNARNWFVHSREWLENPYRRPMLVVSYEDMFQQPDQIIKRIATFLNLDLNEEQINTARQYLSMDFILSNRYMYDESPNPDKVYDQFIRRGKSDKGKEAFSDRQMKLYRRQFKKYLGKFNLPFEPK